MSSPSVNPAVRFLGLSEWVEARDGDAVSFPLGLLYPYSRDLQRACTCFDAMVRQWPHPASLLEVAAGGNGDCAPLSPSATAAAEAFLVSTATLYDRIAFAGTAGASVARAHARVTEELTQRGRLKRDVAGSPVP
jgi:hypothetical protein